MSIIPGVSTISRLPKFIDTILYKKQFVDIYQTKTKININNIKLQEEEVSEIKLFTIPLLGLDKHLNSYYEENGSIIYISNGLGSIHNLRLMNKASMNVYRLYSE